MLYMYAFKLLKTHFLLCLLLLTNTSIAWHYITGNEFKKCSDYTVENNSCAWDPKKVSSNSIIFIESDFLEHFFKDIFPHIKNPIILLTHNGDGSAPGKFKNYLDDPKIVMWFGQNCDTIVHPKFCPIPIGIANPKWPQGNTKVFDEVCNIVHKEKRHKKLHLYINFSPTTNPVRSYLHKLFNNNSLAQFSRQKPLKDYLLEMAQYKFVLSPFGNGLDCHRTWEALLVGSIPVVKTSTLDPLYKDLPVIIVQEWQDITENFLKKKYKEIKGKTYNKEKIFMPYWLALIKKYKNGESQ